MRNLRSSLGPYFGASGVGRNDEPPNLLEFVRLMRPDYVFQPFHVQLCDALTSLARGEIKRLMVNLPPGHGKSEYTSRYFPAYVLGLDPTTRILGGSHTVKLAKEMSRDVKRIMSEVEYPFAARAPTPRDKSVINEAAHFNVFGGATLGMYLGVGVGVGVAGFRGDVILLDDIMRNMEEAYSATARDRAWNWVRADIRTRRAHADVPIGVIGTRWHHDDPYSRMLNDEEWVHLEFPALQDRDQSPEDPRDIGEALWPDVMPADELEAEKARSGRIFSALYQQRPSSEAGEIIKRANIQRYHSLPPVADMRIMQAWDLNFGGRAKSAAASYVCGVCFGAVGSKYYLLEVVRGRWGHGENKRRVKCLRERWPSCEAVLIEDAASGRPLVDDLKGDVPGLVLVPAKGSKIIRLDAVSPLFEAGQVYVPHSAPWVDDYVEELVTFPAGRSDDQVDATSHCLTRLSRSVAAPTDWVPVVAMGGAVVPR